MCGSNSDHDHADGHRCTPGEDYERNLAEQRAHGGISRRQALKMMGSAGLLIAGSAVNAGSIFAANVQGNQIVRAANFYNPVGAGDFDGFYFLAGDHHIHTRYSSDAKYAVQRQVAEANYHDLNWMVITDHGSGTHNKISVDLTYPDIVDSRSAFKNLLVFVGLEMNIPGGEHGTVMVQPNAKEKDQIKQFEAAYDGAIVENTEAKMIEGLKYLNNYDPKPLFFANHPSRRGLDSPHEIRNWKAAAPDVAYGFEGAPGHQAAGLIRDADGKFVAYRGFYGNTPGTGAFADYPLESYFTYGGFDWMTATLGGLWDSLLGDGLRWWITANSDSHKYFNDLQDVDATQFNTTGFVAEANRYLVRPSYGDFRPGEYSKTYVVTTEQSYEAVMAGLRAGSSYVVHGDLIDRLKFTARATDQDGNRSEVGLGGTLVTRRGSEVRLEFRIRVPSTPNWANQRPLVDHIDLIVGQINNPSKTAGPDTFRNPTTYVAQTFKYDSDVRVVETAEGLILSANYTFYGAYESFYARLRGTNTKDYNATPAMDPDLRGQTGPGESPWDDLWFYSNPIFVYVS